jgi:4-diphosphocytidyl-2-C-methyl-D-erythritol kinase
VSVTLKRIVLRSYAKINLGLELLGKRPDGYHEIRTVLQTIGLHDRLTIERTKRRGIRFRSNSNQLDPRDNLVVRAAQLFQKKNQTQDGLRIRLDKQIPPGSGMGGGSSNAAITLLGLSKIYGLSPSSRDLFDWTAQLGSDVSFFIIGGRALGIGRGSEVYPLGDGPQKHVLLAVSRRRVSTADAYKRLSLRLTKQVPVSIIPVFCSGYLDSLNGGRGQENDFERVFFEDFPRLRELKENWYECGAETAGLTGSGSALFGVFTRKKALLKAVATAKQKELRLIQTRTLSRLQYQNGIVESLS